MDDIKYSKPQGGMFAWVYLPKHINTDKLVDKAIERKVVFVPGSPFYPAAYHKGPTSFAIGTENSDLVFKAFSKASNTEFTARSPIA